MCIYFHFTKNLLNFMMISTFSKDTFFSNCMLFLLISYCFLPYSAPTVDGRGFTLNIEKTCEYCTTLDHNVTEGGLCYGNECPAFLFGSFLQHLQYYSVLATITTTIATIKNNSNNKNTFHLYRIIPLHTTFYW